jgi:ribosome recycling factor
MEATKELFRDIEVKMKHAVEHLHHELKSLRTGRASTSILESVVVEYYGTPTPIQQVANLTVADATLLVAQPWDPSQISAIEKGIRAANLGLNPSNDGKVVRIPVPPLTEERRKELVKRAHDMAEHARTSVRSARREGNDKLKALEKDKKLSQDEERRGMDEVQRLHDHYIADIGKSVEHKEKDILSL